MANVHDVAAYMCIHSRERVVHKNDIGVEIDRSRDVQALLLASRERNASLADLGQVAIGQNFNVRSQGARLNDCVVPV